MACCTVPRRTSAPSPRLASPARRVAMLASSATKATMRWFWLGDRSSGSVLTTAKLVLLADTGGASLRGRCLRRRKNLLRSDLHQLRALAGQQPPYRRYCLVAEARRLALAVGEVLRIGHHHAEVPFVGLGGPTPGAGRLRHVRYGTRSRQQKQDQQ